MLLEEVREALPGPQGKHHIFEDVVFHPIDTEDAEVVSTLTPRSDRPDAAPERERKRSHPSGGTLSPARLV